MIVKKTLAFAIILLFISVSVIPSTGNRVSFDDITPPVTTISFDPATPNGDNGWYVNDVTIELVATDDMSGVNATYYRLDGGLWMTYTEPFTVKSDGDYMIEYYSVDNASNVEDVKSVEFKIDQTPPTIDLDWESYNVNGIWYVIFTAWCYDATSGMERVEFFIEDVYQFTDYAEPYEWFIEWNTTLEGCLFYAYAYDIAGNMDEDAVGSPYIESSIIGLIWNPEFSRQNVGPSLLPSTGTIVKKSTMPTFYDGNTLYVGGSGPGNYSKIQDAIDDASDGDTVFVYDDSSPYNENVVVNKSINLIGEDKDTTIIDGGGSGKVVSVYADGVSIGGFNIQNSGTNFPNSGVYIKSNNNTISENIITNNNFVGIKLHPSFNTVISDNIIKDNLGPGIDLARGSGSGCNNNVISNNTLINNKYSGISFVALCNYNTIMGNTFKGHTYAGIEIWLASNNIISNNTFTNNYYGIELDASSNNNIYHNNFFNNTQNAYDESSGNEWDDGYPSGGNYWDDYNGTDGDGDGDGIGDTPYNISGGDNQDRYPLMEPWGDNLFPIAKFTWTPSLPNPNETILFNASDSIDYDGNITLYEWDWDNDGVFDGNHTNYSATHSWSEYGYYPVTLRVTDNDNLTDCKTKTVRVGNLPPDAPIIEGPTSGKIGIEYNYTITATDPDGKVLYVIINWGDNTSSGWLGPYNFSAGFTIKHKWDKKGTYTIRARARDDYGALSDWGTLDITMPKTRNVFLSHWLERFPLLRQLIMRIMERWST